ncbi:MAG TPA: NAD(P)/FAD-dependent oxidoreductase [Gemmatimonas sp.]|nr:NAD(P)/FAD-dependent oxidoreductase [Gemmatimonas sp.]
MPVVRTAGLDAIVVGSGPNGLAAAITLAEAGRSVRVFEAQPTAGGGIRSAALTEPGFVHDVGAAVHSLVLASPFMRALPLHAHGLGFVQPDAPFAHPLDDGTAVIVERSVRVTSDSLGQTDATAYRRLFEQFADNGDALMAVLIGPRRARHLLSNAMRHPLLLSRFGALAVRSATHVARELFSGDRARAALAGVAAHSVLSLDAPGTAGYALGLATAAHAYGWPVIRGGSGALANAMIAYLHSIGGEVVTGVQVDSLDALPPSRAVLCDVPPRELLRIAGAHVPRLYKWRLSRFRHGPGVFKMDWALNAPVPWRDASCARAGTLHLGGTFNEIARAEAEVMQSDHPERPYMLVVQPSMFDGTRAPAGQHTLWAYCHVPAGSTVNVRAAMERQLERFAPGFGDCIIGAHESPPAVLERGNANLVGGDIAGGASDLWQFIARPIHAIDPHRTPIDGVYLCSSSTPPGIGVHGMCGYLAAQSALRHSLA